MHIFRSLIPLAQKKTPRNVKERYSVAVSFLFWRKSLEPTPYILIMAFEHVSSQEDLYAA